MVAMTPGPMAGRAAESEFAALHKRLAASSGRKDRSRAEALTLRVHVPK